MRLTAFFKLYKMCILLHRCNPKIIANSKNRFEKPAIFVKIQQNFANAFLADVCHKVARWLPNSDQMVELSNAKLSQV